MRQSIPQEEPQSSSAQSILSVLSTSAHTFLQPTPSLHAASILIAKKYLDPLASSISDLQRVCQQENRKKRRRGLVETPDPEPTLRLRQVYADGLTVDQVWEQAKKVLEATNEVVARELSEHSQKSIDKNATLDRPGRDATAERRVHFDDDEFMDDIPDDYADEDASETGEESQLDGMDEAEAEHEERDGEDSINGDADEPLLPDEPETSFVEDPNGVNDPFFDIDDFNRQTKFLEQQDAKGDPDDGAASDEEEIDWSADYLASKAPDLSSNMNTLPPANRLEDAEESDTEDGPTFGDDDGNEDSEEDADVEMGTMANTNDVQYADFFAAPARKKSKSTRMRALPKTQPQDRKDETLDEDTERAIADVRRDLFDDDASADDDSDDLNDATEGPRPKTNLSTHEKQKAKLAEEIRKLEAANVAKRNWALSGEARAMDRPINSLIEEDFDFERTGKPVPVITNEVSEGIEELIKRRILAKEFDELIRRHPESVRAAAQARRGKVELDDTKAQQGLAELYEEDHLRATDPNFLDKRDDKLKREHDEISKLWLDISGKLDTLSNWHYKPKPQQASINVVSDVATISMEDARPTTGAEVGENNMLAPQEMYVPGDEGKAQGEVMLKSGAAVAKGEMTREEKLRRRRREKERMKKSGGNGNGKVGQSGKAKEKQEVLGALKRGGVKVIGKKGDVKDVEGRKVVTGKASKSGDALKL